MKKPGKQLELPLPRFGASERKAWIRRRLEGLEYRQRARAAKRRSSYERRKARESGSLPEAPRPQQIPLPALPAEPPPPAKQLPLPIAPFWSL